MAKWPENPRLIGTSVKRLDGLAKASGKAKYPSDMRPEGTLFGAMLYSPHAHAKITSIDISKAEKLPGVKKGRAQTNGKPEAAMVEADEVVEGTYSVPVITHVCLEAHGMTVKWEGDD